MIRYLIAGLLAAAFVVGAYFTLEGWGTPPAAERPARQGKDEVPLAFRNLEGEPFSHYGAMGHPWAKFADAIALLKHDLPIEVTDPDRSDESKRNFVLVQEMKLTLPQGRFKWPKVFAMLREKMEPHGITVFTGPPEVPDTTEIILPQSEWTGFSVLNHLLYSSQRTIAYKVTSRGVCVGTDQACNRAALDSVLGEIRRTTAAERQDRALEVPFRPDLTDASVIGLANAIETQTGVPVVVDPAVWDRGILLRWRGEPRSLRDALDELTLHMRLYWRWHDGRVWLLQP